MSDTMIGLLTMLVVGLLIGLLLGWQMGRARERRRWRGPILIHGGNAPWQASGCLTPEQGRWAIRDGQHTFIRSEPSP